VGGRLDEDEDGGEIAGEVEDGASQMRCYLSKPQASQAQASKARSTMASLPLAIGGGTWAGAWTRTKKARKARTRPRTVLSQMGCYLSKAQVSTQRSNQAKHTVCQRGFWYSR
jgi:hypothetical protein